MSPVRAGATVSLASHLVEGGQLLLFSLIICHGAMKINQRMFLIKRKIKFNIMKIGFLEDFVVVAFLELPRLLPEAEVLVRLLGGGV